MRWVFNDQIRDRIIGLAVILSLLVIFAPSFFTKPQQQLEERLQVVVKMPAKPTILPIVAPTSAALFHKPEPIVVKKTVTVSEFKAAQPLITKAEALHMPLTSVIMPMHVRTIIKKSAQTATIPAVGYGVQLGTFSQKNNAKKLLHQLRKKGYATQYNIIKMKNGSQAYQIIVGHEAKRQQAINLKEKLAVAIGLMGFVVSTRVS